MDKPTSNCPEADVAPQSDNVNNRMECIQRILKADRTHQDSISATSDVYAVEKTEKQFDAHDDNDTNLKSNPWSHIETTVDAILSTIEFLRQSAESVTKRLDEMDKKADLMVWKLAKIESMYEVRRHESDEYVKPRIHVNDKSPVGSEKPPIAPPTSTPRRLYNRKSNITINQCPTLNDTSTVIDVTDDDDSNIIRKKVHGKSIIGARTELRPQTSNIGGIVQGGGEPIRNQPVCDNSIPSITSFHIGLYPKGRVGTFHTPKTQNVGRQLSFTPSYTPSQGKLKKVDAESKQTPKKIEKSKDKLNKRKSPELDEDTEVYTAIGHTLPLYIKTTFRPTVDMGLNPEQIQLCAYVFYPDNPPTEVIFKMGYTEGTRQDFQSLCPGNAINREIFLWMSLKATWMQDHITEQTIWSLPPSFARDVICNTTIEDLLETYAKHWMKPYKELKYIYVPIEEFSGHWYLMVVCLEDQVIYHLDSHITDETIGRRRETMMSICNVLIQMMGSTCFPHAYVNELLHGESWDILQGRGVPRCGHSFNSAIWVLQWLHMEYTFQPNFIAIQLNEPYVRMKVAVELMSGHHNECRDSLESKASQFWSKMTYSRAV